jgi:hypothetical protein
MFWVLLLALLWAPVAYAQNPTVSNPTGNVTGTSSPYSITAGVTVNFPAPFTVSSCTTQIAATAGFFTDSPLVYLENDAGGDPFWIQTKSGSTHWLFQGHYTTPTMSNSVFNNSSTWFSNPNNVLGEFWVMGVFEDAASGRLIALLHNEFADGVNQNVMRLSLATVASSSATNPAGSASNPWIVLGNIVKFANESGAQAAGFNIGGTNPIVGQDGYLYVMYTGTYLARAPISAVLSAAESGKTSAWETYSTDGTFDSPSLDGTTWAQISDPTGGIGASHTSVAYSTYDNHFYTTESIDLLNSPDLIHWTKLGPYLGVCGVFTPAIDQPFYYSLFDPNTPLYNRATQVGQTFFINNAWFKNGQNGNGYVQTGITLNQ